MRILMLVHKFLPSIGGTQILAYNYAKRLVQRGHRVTVLTSSFQASPLVEEIDGIKIMRFNKVDLPFSFPWYVTPKMLPATLQSVKTFDLLHSFYFASFQALTGAIASKLQVRPIFLNSTFPAGSYPRDLYTRTAGRMVLNNANAIFAQSEAERVILSRYVSPKKIRILPPGIDSESYEKLPDLKATRLKCGLHEDDTVLLYVGHITNAKGIPELLHTFASLTRRLKGLKLLLVGDGDIESTKQMAEDLNISDQVQLAGSIPYESMHEVYAVADLFVFPSHFESFGMVLLEAAASGLPIVSTNVGCAAELVLDGKNGKIVSKCNDRFAEACYTILTNPSFRTSAANLRKAILHRYNWETIVDELESAYVQLA